MELQAILETLRKYLSEDVVSNFHHVIVAKQMFDPSGFYPDGEEEKLKKVFGNERMGIFRLSDPFEFKVFPAWLDQESIGKVTEEALKTVIERNAADVLRNKYAAKLSGGIQSDRYTELWDDFYGVGMANGFFELFASEKIPFASRDFTKKIWMDAAEAMTELLFEYSGFSLMENHPLQEAFSKLFLMSQYFLPVWESRSHKIICITK